MPPGVATITLVYPATALFTITYSSPTRSSPSYLSLWIQSQLYNCWAAILSARLYQSVCAQSLNCALRMRCCDEVTMTFVHWRSDWYSDCMAAMSWCRQLREIHSPSYMCRCTSHACTTRTRSSSACNRTVTSCSGHVMTGACHVTGTVICVCETCHVTVVLVHYALCCCCCCSQCSHVMELSVRVVAVANCLAAHWHTHTHTHTRLHLQELLDWVAWNSWMILRTVKFQLFGRHCSLCLQRSADPVDAMSSAHCLGCSRLGSVSPHRSTSSATAEITHIWSYYVFQGYSKLLILIRFGVALTVTCLQKQTMSTTANVRMSVVMTWWRDWLPRCSEAGMTGCYVQLSRSFASTANRHASVATCSTWSSLDSSSTLQTFQPSVSHIRLYLARNSSADEIPERAIFLFTTTSYTEAPTTKYKQQFDSSKPNINRSSKRSAKCIS